MVQVSLLVEQPRSCYPRGCSLKLGHTKSSDSIPQLEGLGRIPEGLCSGNA